jgi:phage shock protein A
MADELAALQRKVDLARQGRSRAERELKTAIRARMRALEQAPPQTATDRPAWLEEQARLAARLARLEPRLAGALPTIPRTELRPSDGPEELRELADELADVRERYMGHADALARSIAELRRRRRLLKLSDDLEREESLFDESMRFRSLRRVASARATTPGSQAAEPGADRASEADPGKTGPAEAASPLPDDGGHAEQAPPGYGAWDPAAEADGDSHRDANDDVNAPSALAGGSSWDEPAPASGGELALPEQPVSRPPADGGGSALPTLTSVQTLLDPGLGHDDPRALGSLGIDEQLRRLQAQRDQVESEARRLMERMRGLRRRAAELEAQEGR